MYDLVCTLGFADQVLTAQDRDDMNYMIRKLTEEYKKWKLDININKTEGEQRNLTLENGQEIKCCAKYKYSIVEITNGKTLDAAIEERNLLGRKLITIQNEIRNTLG